MQEIEAKFFIDSKEEFRKKLVSVGAKKVSDEFLMKRKIYEKPGAPAGDWFRVREEHDKTTLTFKSKRELAIDGMYEVEISVSDFDKCVEILEQAGLEFVTYQESYREVWNFMDTEIVIETWPWLDPFIEIEGGSKEVVIEAASKLGFKLGDAQYGTVLEIYKKVYDITPDEFNTIKKITFDVPIPSILQKK